MRCCPASAPKCAYILPSLLQKSLTELSKVWVQYLMGPTVTRLVTGSGIPPPASISRSVIYVTGISCLSKNLIRGYAQRKKSPPLALYIGRLMEMTGVPIAWYNSLLRLGLPLIT